MLQERDIEPNPTAQNPPVKPEPPLRHPQKITQMQCLQTNYELRNFFIQGLAESFKYLPNILSNIYLQLQLLINFVQYRLTISVDKPHPGDALQNICYKKNKLNGKKKLLYLLLTIILPYLHKRVKNWLGKGHAEWKQKLNNLLIWIEKIFMTLQFINLAIFIYKGKYRTFSQRILNVSMEFIDKNNARVLNFSLMNRKVIWDVYQLFLKTLLPFGHGFFSKALKNIFYFNSYMEADDSHEKNCIICSEKPSMPMKGDCGHLACYYCVSSQNETGEMVCRICNSKIREWENIFK